VRPATKFKLPDAQPVRLVVLPIDQVSKDDDAFVCKPYHSTLRAAACVARQAAYELAAKSVRRAGGSQIPAHLRECGSCGDGIAVRIQIAGKALAEAVPALFPKPPMAAPESPKTPVKQALELIPPSPKPTHVVPAETLARAMGVTPAPADLESRLATLEKRMLDSTMQILDAIDQLRGALTTHVDDAAESPAVALEELRVSVLGRPGIIAEELLKHLVEDDPRGFSDLLKRTGFTRDVLKNALGRLKRTKRADFTDLGWVRT
jgi:hypothetical protein